MMDRAILSRSLDSLDTSLSRQLSLSAILRVSSTPDVRLGQLPKEVGEAQSSLASAMALCRRNSLRRDKKGGGDEKRKKETLRLWFTLQKVVPHPTEDDARSRWCLCVQVLIDALKNLPHLAKKQKKSIHVPSGFYHKGIIKKNDQFHEYPRLAFLRDIYAALMDEVITAMAGKPTLRADGGK